MVGQRVVAAVGVMMSSPLSSAPNTRLGELGVVRVPPLVLLHAHDERLRLLQSKRRPPRGAGPIGTRHTRPPRRRRSGRLSYTSKGRAMEPVVLEPSRLEAPASMRPCVILGRLAFGSSSDTKMSSPSNGAGAGPWTADNAP